MRHAAQEAALPLLMKPLRPLALKSVLDRMLAARGAGAVPSDGRTPSDGG